MFPYLYQAPEGGVSIPTYGMLMMLAFVAATALAFFRMRRVGIHPDLLPGIVVIAILLGIFGARLLHFLGADPGALTNPLVLFKLNEGGMAVYGGVLAAGIGCFAYARRRGVNPWKLCDALLPCFFLALAIGRLGCIAAGCCHGAAIGGLTDSSGAGMLAGEAPKVIANLTGTSLSGGSFVQLEGAPWLAAVYNPGVGVGRIFEVPCYPTQLWEILAALTLFGLLSWTWAKKRTFDGQILALGMLFYPFIRSNIERFRGDDLRGVDHFSILSTSQVVSIAVAMTAVIIWRVRSPLGLSEEVALVAEEVEVDEELFQDLD
ncbi:MAG: prolipoprotein diacylglyceryl transferase family protein [Myxococcota bacterium]|nr:prolipoprotein diacylglyceryl transferase family protein [Myxococcota bacterium]